MSSGGEKVERPARESRRVSRRLVVILLALAILAVGANLAWRFRPVTLEPLPMVPMGRMEPEVRNLIAGATAKVAQNSRAAAAWGDLGAIFFVNGFEGPAQVCFRNAERLDRADYRWPYLLGLSLLYTDAEQTLVCLRRAVELCGERPHVQLRLVDLLLDRGELEEADARIQSLQDYAATSSRLQFAKARLLFAQGNLEEAKTWAERSAAAAPNKRAPHLLLAQLCRRTHDAQGETKALAAIEKIPDGFTPWEDPDIVAILAQRQDRATRLARAENLAQSGDAATAKGILYEMTAGSDGSSAATKLAKTLIRESKFHDAELLLHRQLSGSPNDERLHFLLGGAYFQQEKYAEAEAEYRRVIELKPDNVDSWFNLGLARLKLGKPDEARDAFATTVRISPSRVFARINLAELLLAEGNNEGALEQAEAAVKIAPEEKQALELLARAKAGGK